MGLCRLGTSITPAAIFVFYVKLFNFLNIYTIKTLTPRKTAVLCPPDFDLRIKHDSNGKIIKVQI